VANKKPWRVFEKKMSERQSHQQHYTTTATATATLIKNELDVVDDIDETGTVHFERKDDNNQLQQRQLDDSADDVDVHEPNIGCWQNRVTKVVLQVVFSTPGLIVLVVLYTVMGALVFPLLETSGAATTANRNLPSISKSRDECLKELWIITGECNHVFASETTAAKESSNKNILLVFCPFPPLFWFGTVVRLSR
jgi:hypothetical protein